jgi:hypothetical protein
MRQAFAYVTSVCAIAALVGVPQASAGCDCGWPAAYLLPYAPLAPQPIYVVNQGTYPYPYVHGYEFYGRPRYFGGWHGWRHAHPVPPAWHPYGLLEK